MERLELGLYAHSERDDEMGGRDCGQLSNLTLLSQIPNAELFVKIPSWQLKQCINCSAFPGRAVAATS
jgi:hypothetical protein